MATSIPSADDAAPARSIAYRAKGTRHGPLTRLFGPTDLAEKLKPFLLLDLFQKDGAQSRFGLHPHSGIATLTYVAEGTANYTDPSGESGLLTDGSLEYMKAGRGMWHAGGSEAGAIIGIQLWVALPPQLELTPYESSYIPAEAIEADGPTRVLLGARGGARSQVNLDLPINYFAVTLAAGERWRYAPPPSHRVAWLAVAKGAITAPERVEHGELAIFDDGAGEIVVDAASDVVFVIGSAEPHAHDLVVGNYSVHTNSAALAEGERNIADLGAALRREGRL